MGAGLSDEEEGSNQERAPCNERYLHWLLSDPTRVEEAFKPVWRACSTDEQGAASKAVVLEVMLRVVAEFERSDGGDSSDGSRAAASAKTPRQLARVVSLMPETLMRTEALHLFRTALMSVQASLVMKLGQALLVDWPQSPAYSPGSPGDGAGGGSLPSVVSEAAAFSPGGPGRIAVQAGHAQCPNGAWRYGAASAATAGPPSGCGGSARFGALGAAGAAGGTAHPVPCSRAITRAEDHTPKLRVMRPHPAVKAAPLHRPGVLPSREELDVENTLLRDLAGVVEASAREELAVVRALEEELRAGEASGEFRHRRRSIGVERGGDDALFLALEAKADATEQEVTQLELKVKARDRELTECEAEVAKQQREIHSLLAKRGEEEANADEFSREARDLNLELKSCRRTCGSLESEIASEEARAAALRQAFEGRRARFTTAETAARNAELSTMRATRRRIAAEAAARREACAVEEAENARSLTASNSALKVEALESELEEVRRRATQPQVAGSAPSTVGRRASLAAQAEQALAALRAELHQAESERDDESVAAHASANEVAELEVSRARLEGQLAGRESELHAVQRRALRVESVVTVEATASCAPAACEDDEREVGHMMAAMQAVESRAARIKQRELEMCSELRALAVARSCEVSPDSMVADPEEELQVDAAWRRAREVGAELGEAHAALARRRAQDKSSVGSDVVAALLAVLEDAEVREAQRCTELTEACNRLTVSLAEQHSLRQRAARLAQVSHDGLHASTATSRKTPSAPGRIDALEAKAAALEEEHRERSRALLAVESQVAEVRAQVAAEHGALASVAGGGVSPGGPRPASPETKVFQAVQREAARQ